MIVWIFQVLGKTIEQLKGHVEPGAKGLTLIKVSSPLGGKR
jgi:hypothetical protein